MTPERFQRIIAAYGVEPDRWPADERKAAIAFVRNNSAMAKKLIAKEADLDGMLDAYRVAAANADLTGRVLADAQRIAPVRRAVSRMMIWRGVGIAGIGLAGALAGAVLVTTLSPMTTILLGEDDVPITTAFDSDMDEYGIDEWEIQ